MVLDNQTMEKINTFSNAIDTSFYASRNQFDPSKRTRDQVVGKMGEFATYHYLKHIYPNLSEPDLKIYTISKKSWDFDLKSEDPQLNLHVKSQSLESGQRYGVSWIFQNGDHEIFNSTKQNQYISFVSADMNNTKCTIQAVVKLEHLHENKLFKLPVLKKLQEMNKLAIYFDDLKKFQLFQLGE